LAVSQDSGTTYESLINLSNHQIIGTWDKSKLKNQFVNSGEILFDHDTTYAGAPAPPVLLTPSSIYAGVNTNITLAWVQNRSDLVSGYNIQYAPEVLFTTTLPLVSPYIYVPSAYFAADEGVTDISNAAIILGSSLSGGVLTITANNNFLDGQPVQLQGTAETFLNGITVVVLHAYPTYFTSMYFTAAQSIGFGNNFNNTFGFGSYSNPSDTGSATVTLGTQLTPVTTAPGLGQYTVSPTGLYTFNAQQAGHSIQIGLVQVFSPIATVGAGSILTTAVQLPSGGTYYFRVQATSLDGSSGWSNIQGTTV
jgi:hypothetical protein